MTLSQTGFGMLYPRALDVATSVDGERWTPAFSGPTAGLMVSDALAHEANPQLKLPLTAAPARWIRLTVSRTLERDPWVVTDVTVRGLSAPR